MTIKQAVSWLSQPGIVAMIHDPTTKKAVQVAIKALSANDTNVGTKLGTNLAEVGTDTISRQDAIDAAIEATDSWEGFCSIGRQKRIENYINSLPFAPGTDMISRQAAIDICANVIDLFREQFGAGVLVAIKESIEELPSAQPEIIRCRECKFASGDSRICMKFDHSPIGELDFCAWAERRTDEMQ